MDLSFSKTASFSGINWDNLENRPPINEAFTCSELQWFEYEPCCMSGYSMEYVIETGLENGFSDSKEFKFLSKYPCLNGPELDVFFEKFSSQLQKTNETLKNEVTTCQGSIGLAWKTIKDFFN